MGEYFSGLSISFILSFCIGAGIPLLIYAPASVSGIMLLLGIIISVVFVSIAFLSSILTRDKAKGIGLSIMLWLYFALLFDGLVLFLLFQLSDYPIEKAMVFITAFSPVDLARILILLHLDVSAMMGYTGAIFKNFFGTSFGFFISMILLCCWIAIPFWISLIRFRKRFVTTTCIIIENRNTAQLNIISMKGDIKDRKDIELLVNTFYEKIKTDKSIGPFFAETTNINLIKHLSVMYDFGITSSSSPETMMETH